MHAAFRCVVASATRTRGCALTTAISRVCPEASVPSSGSLFSSFRHGLLGGRYGFIPQTLHRVYGTERSMTNAYVCEWPSCGQTCRTPFSLRVHMRVHTGERPYACEYPGCGKRFTQGSSLANHMRLHTGELPYSCDFPGCDKKLRTLSNWVAHRRVHTGERPYKCGFPGCDKAFKQSTHAVRHRETHADNTKPST